MVSGIARALGLGTSKIFALTCFLGTLLTRIIPYKDPYTSIEDIFRAPYLVPLWLCVGCQVRGPVH